MLGTQLLLDTVSVACLFPFLLVDDVGLVGTGLRRASPSQTNPWRWNASLAEGETCYSLLCRWRLVTDQDRQGCEMGRVDPKCLAMRPDDLPRVLVRWHGLGLAEGIATKPADSMRNTPRSSLESKT